MARQRAAPREHTGAVGVMDNGYVFLHRRILQSELWSLRPYQILIAEVCLLRATWRDTKVQGIQVKRGQWLTHYQAIADLCPRDTTARQVRHTIKILSSERIGFLVTRSVSHRGRHFLLVTVCHYNRYQPGSGRRVTRLVSRCVQWLSRACHRSVTTLNEDLEDLEELKKTL